MPPRLFSALLALLALFPAAAHAAARPPPSVRLVYSRSGEAESCPPESAVRAAVAARLGADPFREPAELIVRASLTSDSGTLRAHIEAQTAAGEPRGGRELTSRAKDCGELASAMDLAISIAIDPLALVRAPPGQPAPAPAEQAARCPAPAPCPPCGATSAPTPELAPASEPWRLQARLGPAVSFGVSPDLAAYGATIGLELRKGAFLLGLEGRADFPSNASFAGGSVGTSLLMVSAVPCWRASYVGLCGVLSGGAQRANGERLPAAHTVTAPYLAAGARVLGELHLTGPLSLRADAELKAALTRTSVLVGEQTVWSTPPISGGLGLELVILFL